LSDHNTASKKLAGKKPDATFERQIQLRRNLGYASLVHHILFYFLRYGLTLEKPKSYEPHDIPEDFFGINIAPGNHEEVDDYLIERLKELGVSGVRIDYGTVLENKLNVDRLLPKLHQNNFKVLLHLVPTTDEAMIMGTPEGKEHWRTFVTEALENFHDKIDSVELGSTINRYIWARAAISDYMELARIGSKVCDEYNVPWLGPNVTDFSPMFNIGILSKLKFKKLFPHAHTNNLFVDRVGQAENLDTKVLKKYSEKLDLDFVRKSRFLATLSKRFGIKRTYSTYNYWTLDIKSKKKARYVTEEQYASYLVRYLVLAVTAGHLDRVYWGQMISHAKGIIADGSGHKPRIPTVHHKWCLLGDYKEYKIRPGFRAMSSLLSVLKDMRFVQRLKTKNSTYAFEFTSKKNDEHLVIGWTKDCLLCDLSQWFEEGKQSIKSVTNIYGKDIPKDCLAVTSSPIYIHFSGEQISAEKEEFKLDYLGRILMPIYSDKQFRIFANDQHRGIIRSDISNEQVDEFLKQFESTQTSDSKSKVVKKLQDSPYQLITFPAEKTWLGASRSHAAKVWNNCAECNYRGVESTFPVVLLENFESPIDSTSALVFEQLQNSMTVNEIIRDEKKISELLGLTKKDFLFELGTFLIKMHNSGIMHGDLSLDHVHIMMNKKQTKHRLILSDLSKTRFFRRMKRQDRRQELSKLELPESELKLVVYAYSRGKRKKFKRNWKMIKAMRS